MQQQHKSAYEQLIQYRDQLAADLHRVENAIQDAEYAYYTAEHSQAGHVLKGFDAYLASKEALRKRQARGFKLEDRLFSLSSRSSPLAKELGESEALEGNLGPGAFGRKGYTAKGSYAQKGKR